MKILLMAYFSLCVLFATSQSRISLTETQRLYDSLIVKTTVSSIPWTGNYAKCDRGTIPQDIINKAAKRINFFRKMNGLPLVKNNTLMNPDAQTAALFIAANHKLTHTPTSNMKCYSATAVNGCQKSCLSLPNWQYRANTAFIIGFIEDFGDHNYYTGHRRWLLYSRLAEFGYGATQESEAVMTLDGVTDLPAFTPEFIAYPWNGFIPNALVFPKWSFSLPDKYKVDFSKAKITLKDDAGKTLNISVQKEKNNYLDPTIVWIVNDLFTPDEIKKNHNKEAQAKLVNKKFTISIQNVLVDQTIKNYSYSVSVF